MEDVVLRLLDTVDADRRAGRPKPRGYGAMKVIAETKGMKKVVKRVKEMEEAHKEWLKGEGVGMRDRWVETF